MRIRDWSSDVCSSDLDLVDVVEIAVTGRMPEQHQVAVADDGGQDLVEIVRDAARKLAHGLHLRRLRNLLFKLKLDRTSVVYGRSVSVRVVLGGRRIIKKINLAQTRYYRYIHNA